MYNKIGNICLNVKGHEFDENSWPFIDIIGLTLHTG